MMQAQKELQLEWDLRLLDGWYKNQPLIRLCCRFMFDHSGDWTTIETLRRSPLRFATKLTDGVRLRSQDGGVVTTKTAIPIRAFISNYYPTLSEALWSGKYEKQELLAFMRSGRCKRRKAKQSSRNVRMRTKYKTSRVIRARDLQSRPGWKTVK